ncbi:MAG: transposase [Anaerolineae bacterium]|nr:transposase [Anaerolineae bacterium]
MTKQRKRYPKVFKQEALQLWATSEKSAAEIEQDLGITNGLLYQWKKASKKRATAETDGSAVEAAELRRLRQELTLVKQERDILKRSRSFVASPPGTTQFGQSWFLF